MTVVIPEVAEAVEGGGEAAAARRGTRRPARARVKTLGQAPDGRRFSGTGGSGRAAGRSGRVPLPPSVRSAAAQRARSTRAGYGRQARHVASQGVLAPGDRNYQPLILAEFLLAETLVALAPVARGSGGSGTSPSPYQVNDLVQLVAIAAVYFVLALASSGSHGKIAAGAGGLVLLTLLLRGANSGSLNSVFGLFTATGAGQAAGTSTAGGRGTGTTSATGATGGAGVQDA